MPGERTDRTRDRLPEPHVGPAATDPGAPQPDDTPLARSGGGVDFRGLQGILSTVQDATRAEDP